MGRSEERSDWNKSSCWVCLIKYKMTDISDLSNWDIEGTKLDYVALSFAAGVSCNYNYTCSSPIYSKENHIGFCVKEKLIYHRFMGI